MSSRVRPGFFMSRPAAVAGPVVPVLPDGIGKDKKAPFLLWSPERVVSFAASAALLIAG